MKPVLPGLTRLAAALLGAAALLTLSAAERELPPSKRNAPKGQQLEFYPAAAPQLPRPTTRADEFKNQKAPVGERSNPEIVPSFTPAPLAPTKAFAERMLKEMDRKKNWMIPGAQEDILGENSWATKGYERDEKSMEMDGDKPKSVLERFLSGADNKNKVGKKESDREKEKRFDDDSNNDPYQDPGQLDADKEPKGISDFSLQSALNPSQPRADVFGRREPDRAFQPLRGELSGSDPTRAGRDRDKERDREAAHAADFHQLIQPRSAIIGFSGLRDPINSSPDLTRRDMNPIMPRAAMEQARPESGPFNPTPTASPFRAPDSGILGVATPMTPSFSSGFPAASAQINTSTKASQSIILEPPRRKFN